LKKAVSTHGLSSRTRLTDDVLTALILMEPRGGCKPIFRTQHGSRELSSCQPKKHFQQCRGCLDCPFENRYWMNLATDTRLSQLPLLHPAQNRHVVYRWHILPSLAGSLGATPRNDLVKVASLCRSWLPPSHMPCVQLQLADADTGTMHRHPAQRGSTRP
jgi:hypothetical protein